MKGKTRNGHLLTDTMMSLVIISLITTILFKYYATISDIVRHLDTKQQVLYSTIQIMESALHDLGELPPQNNISIQYVPIYSNVIQGKPADFSFNFENNFAFVVVTNTSKKKRKLKLISALKRGE